MSEKGIERSAKKNNQNDIFVGEGEIVEDQFLKSDEKNLTAVKKN